MKWLMSEEELLSVLDRYDFKDDEFEGFVIEQEKEENDESDNNSW